MATRLEAVPENIRISTVTSINPVILREIATLTIVAWGRNPTADQIDQRIQNLEQEVKTLEPSKKGLFVAQKQEMIVGFSKVVRDENDVSQWWLLGLVVHPHHRRQRIGSAVVRACITYAQQQGARIIRSETHLDNEASIRCHESVGFQNDGKFMARDGDEKIAFSFSLP